MQQREVWESYSDVSEVRIVSISREKKLCHEDLGNRLLCRYNIYLYLPYYTVFDRAMYGKGNAIPLQAWRGLEGSMILRLPDFNTIGT